MIKNRFFKFLVFLLIFLNLFAITPSFIAEGEIVSTKYSNVLEDLTKDEKFNVNDYPEIEDDYSLDVIQIAEGENKELFIYVYQPSNYSVDFFATSINLSLTNSNQDIRNYSLEIISSSGVFDKYLVKGVTVGTTEIRTYKIISIFRPWNEEIDESSGTDNIINEVSFPVAKCWYATEQGGKTVYICKKEDVITVTDRWDGFVSYNQGFFLYQSTCRSHFIAFNTDKKIEDLLEARVSFTYQIYDVIHSPPLYIAESSYSPEVGKVVDFSSSDIATTDPKYPWINTFSWNRIVSAEEFLKEPELNLSDDAIKNISSKSWVLRFYESSATFIFNGNNYDSSVTNVNEVTILRLKFVTDGISYDLGVIDNKMTADTIPDGFGITVTLSWFWVALSIVVVAGVLIFLYKSLEK